MLSSNNVKELLIRIANTFMEKQEELSRLDSVIGDGDHGVTMARGAKASLEKMISMEEGSCRDYFKTYGRTLISTLGGAIGPLFGCIFLEISKVCKGKEIFGLEELAQGLKNAELKIIDLGGASVGDKTMLDAIHPTVESLLDADKKGLGLNDALYQAVIAADEGLKSTIPLIAKRGRSKYVKEKAIGHQDAGATSFYYLMKTMYEYVQGLV